MVNWSKDIYEADAAKPALPKGKIYYEEKETIPVFWDLPNDGDIALYKINGDSYYHLKNETKTGDYVYSPLFYRTKQLFLWLLNNINESDPYVYDRNGNVATT